MLLLRLLSQIAEATGNVQTREMLNRKITIIFTMTPRQVWDRQGSESGSQIHLASIWETFSFHCSMYGTMTHNNAWTFLILVRRYPSFFYTRNVRYQVVASSTLLKLILFYAEKILETRHRKYEALRQRRRRAKSRIEAVNLVASLIQNQLLCG